MIKPYKKDFDYSYTLGFYPSFELVKYHPEIIEQVYIQSNSISTEGAIKLQKSLSDKQFIESDKLFSRLAAKENDHVAIVFKKYSETLDSSLPHVVLVNPSDQGNLGNIMRSMAAFNYRDLAIITPSADRFNPKVIRSSMGSCFFVRQECFSSFEDYIQKYPRTCYTFMLQAQKGLKEVSLQENYALVFGNEARGLEDYFLRYNPIKIEQPGEVDSLNLPTAVAIALYETRITSRRP